MLDAKRSGDPNAATAQSAGFHYLHSNRLPRNKNQKIASIRNV